ncbi:MAG TPA: GNAT family N-acetyltransferase, partial [Kofleriaceae bacterium]|nr:GNAT family N-acetyltransferase [Kofleriaceae bacterium]
MTAQPTRSPPGGLAVIDSPMDAPQAPQLSCSDSATRLGIALPDLPRWVEAHGLLAEPTSWVERWPGGGLVGQEDAGLAVVCGLVDRPAVTRLAAEHPGVSVLCAPEETLSLPGRSQTLARLYVLSEPVEDPGQLVSPLDPRDELGHLPAELRRELTWALGRRRVWAAWVDGQPVSFAYASWRSPRWFDVSVDTLPGYRQLGLATLVARALIVDERTRGRQPVWGATEDNLASQRLAASLGFVEHDKLRVFAPE